MAGVKQPMPGVVYAPQWHIDKYARLGVLGQRGLIDALREALSEFAERVALTGPEGERTFRELDVDSDRFACALLDMGMKPLDRVIFQVLNSNELVVALLACWKACLIPVCTLAAHREREIGYLAQHAGARAHFVGVEAGFDFLAFADQIRAATPSMEHLVVVRGEAPEGRSTMSSLIDTVDSDAAAARIEAIERDAFQVCTFQLSGGTTSVPKIIPRFGNEYLYNIERAIVHNNYTADDVALLPLQIIHNASMCAFLPSLMLVGGCSVVLPKMDPLSVLSALLEYKPSVFAINAGALGKIKDHGLLDSLNLERARLIISQNSARQIDEVLGKPGVHIFGMTEGVVAFGHPQEPPEVRWQTIGQPLSAHDELKIVAPGTDRELPHGEIGEMICRGPYTIFGYYDAEERNREAFNAEGFYRSGDLMAAHEVDGEVYYSFEGRLKDLVDRGGEKINCEEVEHTARKHPAIHDIAVVAMPDPDLGERACAFVLLAHGARAPTTSELMDFLMAEGLAKYKSPERIELLEEFPMTTANKLDKPRLKAIITEKLTQEAA
ncbi:MAG: AMP-binding protein [Pseudomonadota bacterium]